MAKKALVINKFSGGLNSYSDPRDIEDNEFQILDNACVDEQGIIRVSGAFNSSDSIYNEQILPDDYDASYANLPIAGKGFYSFIIDSIGSPVFMNRFLKSNNTSNTSAWSVEEVNNDSTGWLFEQELTFNTESSITKYSNTSKAAINYVNMSTVNDGDATAAATDGVYDMGNLKLKNIFGKRESRNTFHNLVL